MDASALLETIKTKHPKALLGSQDRFGVLEIRVDRAGLVDVARTLKEDPSLAFEMLIDIVSIDYSLYPDRTGDRYGLTYLFKSLTQGHRLQVKVFLPEDDPSVNTLCGFWANANHLEREAFDQMGIRFIGHPNLKRILNHHEFIGHPLRKDYPITQRQWLSASQSLMDEMEPRLKEKGYI